MTQTAPSKPLQIFKPGQHRTMAGQSISFSESDLIQTVNAYDPAVHEAPLVVGHPKHDLPAYGWVQSLSFSEGGIDATPAQVNADFADMVAAGAYKRISASFYGPDAPQNPVPGVYYLRHVGFLGAQAPAVKGLRTPSFADSEEGVVEFSEWDDVDNASLWRNLREWFIGKFGQAEADTVIPGHTVQRLETGAQDEVREATAQALATTPTPQFSESQLQEPTVTEEEAALLRAQLATLQASNEALVAERTAAAAATTHAAHVAFCEGLQGLPKIAHGAIVTTLDHLASLQAPVEFGEGDARAPLLDQLKAALTALPAPVQFGEFAVKGRDAAVVDFADAQSISDAAAAYQADAHAKGQDITHAQAVAAVTANHK